MERRALLALGGALFLVLGVFWWAMPPGESSVLEMPSIAFPPGVDVQGRGITLLRLGSDGKSVLRAARGFGVRNTSQLKLEKVEVQTEALGEKLAAISAETCIVPADSRVLELSGNVVAQTPEGYLLETTHINYNWDLYEADTDAPVQLSGPGFDVRGDGAHMDWKEQVITIHRNVTATLVPGDLPEEALGKKK